MDILKQLAEEFKIRNTQVENTVKLIDDGNTIPVSYTHLTLPTNSRV